MSHKSFKIFLFTTIFILVTFFKPLKSIEIVNCRNCTVLPTRLHVFQSQILKRRKRAVLFPKKAFVLISQAFTKAIIDGRPPGVSYSIEFDMYSQLPDTIEAWQPTILNNKLKAEKLQAEKEAAKAAKLAPTPKPPVMPPEMMPVEMTHHDTHDFVIEDLQDFDIDSWAHSHDYHDFHNAEHNEVDIDAPPPPPAMISPRFWTSPFYEDIKRRYQLKQKDFQQMSKFYRKHLWKNPKENLFKTKFNDPRLHSTEDIQHWPPIEEEVYESEEEVPAWKYHQAYRERRDLFHQMETLGKIFNFDMKACIQRAMCELQTKLKPYGESLMEDIVRIILTIPKRLNFHDDYSFDFRQHDSKPNCIKIFKKTCPYRVLDFLTNTLSTIKLEDVKHNAM